MVFTQSYLKNDLERLGVCRGMTVLVHTSLSAVGHVCGGPVALILALEDILGDEGTLVMPTHSNDLTDPTGWTSPPVPEGQLDLFLNEMPPFSVDLTPTRNMGVVSEVFRKQDGVIRSPHPHVSFSARGREAERICGEHPLANSLGPASPLGRIYDLKGFVLLIGVGHERNTSLHLAEYLADRMKTPITARAPMLVNGSRQWVEFEDIEIDDSSFGLLGSQFEEETASVQCGTVGGATARLVPQVSIVDYACQKWSESNAMVKKKP